MPPPETANLATATTRLPRLLPRALTLEKTTSARPRRRLLLMVSNLSDTTSATATLAALFRARTSLNSQLLLDHRTPVTGALQAAGPSLLPLLLPRAIPMRTKRTLLLQSAYSAAAMAPPLMVPPAWARMCLQCLLFLQDTRTRTSQAPWQMLISSTKMSIWKRSRTRMMMTKLAEPMKPTMASLAQWKSNPKTLVLLFSCSSGKPRAIGRILDPPVSRKLTIYFAVTFSVFLFHCSQTSARLLLWYR